MFHLTKLLNHKDLLSLLWFATHLDKRVEHKKISNIDLIRAVHAIQEAKVDLSLTVIVNLTLGLCRVLYLKTKYCQRDCDQLHELLVELVCGTDEISVIDPEKNCETYFVTVNSPALLELDDLERMVPAILPGPTAPKHLITLPDLIPMLDNTNVIDETQFSPFEFSSTIEEFLGESFSNISVTALSPSLVETTPSLGSCNNSPNSCVRMDLSNSKPVGTKRAKISSLNNSVLDTLRMKRVKRKGRKRLKKNPRIKRGKFDPQTGIVIDVLTKLTDREMRSNMKHLWQTHVLTNIFIQQNNLSSIDLFNSPCRALPSSLQPLFSSFHNTKFDSSDNSENEATIHPSRVSGEIPHVDTVDNKLSSPPTLDLSDLKEKTFPSPIDSPCLTSNIDKQFEQNFNSLYSHKATTFEKLIPLGANKADTARLFTSLLNKAHLNSDISLTQEESSLNDLLNNQFSSIEVTLHSEDSQSSTLSVEI